jgi:hypothetical protein
VIKFPRLYPVPFRVPVPFPSPAAAAFAGPSAALAIPLAILFALAAPARAAGPGGTAPGSAEAAPGPNAAGRAGPSAYGLIWLDVEPGPAEVSLDGEFLDAGVWLISVSPGDHDLRIRKAGFRGYAGRVAVPAGGSVHLDVRLQPGAAGDS